MDIDKECYNNMIHRRGNEGSEYIDPAVDRVPVDIDATDTSLFRHHKLSTLFRRHLPFCILAFFALILFINLFDNISHLRGHYYLNSLSTNEMKNLAFIAKSIHSIDGNKVTLHNIESITFLNENYYELNQVMRGRKRIWSHFAIKIAVGDTVHWRWSTNENIVSCDANGYILKSNLIINSGKLSESGTHEKPFTTPGTYYYTSENSQTMRGVIVVLPGAEVNIKNNRLNGSSFSPVPWGVQRDMPLSQLQSMDGCWKPCRLIGTTELDTLIKCASSSEWIFVSVINDEFQLDDNSQRDNEILAKVGAFGRSSAFKKDFTSKIDLGKWNDQDQSQSIPISQYTALEENGVFWYNVVGTYKGQELQKSRSSGSDSYGVPQKTEVFGFAPQKPILKKFDPMEISDAPYLSQTVYKALAQELASSTSSKVLNDYFNIVVSAKM